MKYTSRPLSDRTWLRPERRRERARFTSTWSDTLELLDRELRHIDGKSVVIECDVREQDIRLDGMIRANARAPESPAVIVAFESKHGPLVYRSDLYGQRAYGAKTVHVWQENVRAVALTLESLRAVDRYGASAAGEQYRGYKALGAGSGNDSGMTADVAWSVLRDATGIAGADGLSRPALVRLARATSHPDRRDGDRGQWDRVEQAIGVLTRSGALL